MPSSIHSKIQVVERRQDAEEEPVKRPTSLGYAALASGAIALPLDAGGDDNSELLGRKLIAKGEICRLYGKDATCLRSR